MILPTESKLRFKESTIKNRFRDDLENQIASNRHKYHGKNQRYRIDI